MNQINKNHIVRIQRTDSTNNYANQQIRLGGLPEGTVFLTYDQSAGRGQMKNSWESEPGKNLTFSMILYPDFLEIRRQFLLSKVVVLGIYTALNK
jgi:BirA family biotin operon repressor/biotin-[acetyl-CoA-carboxylase] ligase